MAWSVEKRWKMRTGSSEESAITMVVRWLLSVREAMAASSMSGADTA